MPSIIYDVAVSVDGYISGPDGDISGFAHEGAVVDDYQARLATYGIAIMGRHTYEFGYRFGLTPGQNPYPHMDTIVFSQSIALPADGDVRVIDGPVGPALQELIERSDTPIYLCGGGAFAGALLELGFIDVLRLKRAPILLGGGVSLFGASKAAPLLTCLETRPYDNGYLFQEYRLDRPAD
ncbi:dihydrofolate reductase family protein [Hoeflea prorocentri]|uniref:Dihydrofolate reductase family protein n=1 Tax=Hoeflea prorocentri TaxID=1922333 RepID=A0A9X3ZHF1_9HYPH|nr:dihydrofolate reductase family protein [Hoeflea prorocentri]MCY6381732.1 dihydrofolate reductase family protein [Hoeflea prorocentri]MDA5399532.1 dihydrofolate reductase family protein [Hoeflea prorocentri]